MTNSHQAVDVSLASMDYAEHERTYRHFVKFAALGLAHIAAILALMAIFLI